MLLMEVHDGLFADPFQSIAAPDHDGWRLVTPCGTDLSLAAGAPVTRQQVFDACPLLDESARFGVQDHAAFQLLMDFVLARAIAGQPWRDVTTTDQLHEVGKARVRMPGGASLEHTVWQFAKRRTLARILWFYTGKRKVMLITHSFVKRGGKELYTPPAERDRAEQTLQTFINAAASGQAKLIEAQGGRNALKRLCGDR